MYLILLFFFAKIYLFSSFISMNSNIISKKSFDFAVRIVKLSSWLDSQSSVTRTLSKQILRSGTSIGANVSESQSAQSSKDFINKLEIALKEARETEYWLKLLVASEVISQTKLQLLLQDVDELIRILVSILKTKKQNL
jgi:four helix bundle protein